MFSVSFSRSKLLSFIKVLILGGLLGLSIQSLYAWTAPGAAAPGGNVSGPITAGLFTTYQIRNAGLGLTGSLNVSNVGAQNNKVTAPKICLNNDGSETNCITAWPSGGAAGSADLPGCTVVKNNLCSDPYACWGGAVSPAYSMHPSAAPIHSTGVSGSYSTWLSSGSGCPSGTTRQIVSYISAIQCGADGSGIPLPVFLCIGGGGSAATGDNLGNHTATQILNMTTHRITNVVNPVNNQDAATKAYVDSRVSVNDWTNINNAPRGAIVAGCAPGANVNPSDNCWGGADVGGGFAPGGNCPAGTTRKGTILVNWENWPRELSGGMFCIKN